MIKNIIYVISLLLTISIIILSSGQIVQADTTSHRQQNSYTNQSNGPDVLINPVNGPSVTHQLINRTKSAWPWYITRAAGLMAAFLLVSLILSGVGLITGYTFKFLEPLTAWATHRAIGLAFMVSVIIHGFALLFDQYVPFNISQALIPFISNYRQASIDGYHLGSIYVALGIIAFYIILAIILTSLFWIDKKPYKWKTVHFLSYLVMIFVFFHALYLGTDLMHGTFRYLWIIAGILVTITIIYRLQRSRIRE